MIRLINEWLYKILDANLNVADGVILYFKRYAKSEIFLCHWAAAAKYYLDTII